MSSSFGRIFRLTTFGESHGPALGLILDGVPAGLALSEADIQQQLDRRRPGQSALTTPRQEADRIEILSGLFEGRTTGAPLGMLIRNSDAKSADYEAFRHTYRPSHADYTYTAKYGFRDHRGGGRSSARETAARVAAGAVAQVWLRQQGITVQAWVSQVGTIALPLDADELDLSLVESNPVRCPDPATAARMQAAIEEVRSAGDTLGGVVSARIQGLPVGLGEPVFDKFHQRLGSAMLSINAVKGFEYGSGFAGVALKGSQHNDAFEPDGQGGVRTRSNHSGGVQGGITNGAPVDFRVAFKPVATIRQAQDTLDDQGHAVKIEGKGRHDPCVLPRAVPIVEAMAALVVADFLLLARMNRV